MKRGDFWINCEDPEVVYLYAKKVIERITTFEWCHALCTTLVTEQVLEFSRRVARDHNFIYIGNIYEAEL